jgi:hypothetical protein
MKKIDYFKKWAELKLQVYEIEEQNKVDLVCLSKSTTEQIDELFRSNFDMPKELYIINDINNQRIYLSKDKDAGYWSDKEITIKLNKKNITNTNTNEMSQVSYLLYEANRIVVDQFDNNDIDIDYFLNINRLKLDIAEQFHYQSQFYQELLGFFIEEKEKNIRQTGDEELKKYTQSANEIRNQYLEKRTKELISSGFTISNYMSFNYKLSDNVYLKGRVKFQLNPGGKTYTITSYNTDSNTLLMSPIRSKVAYVNELIKNYLKENDDPIAKDIRIIDSGVINCFFEYYDEPTN